MIPIPPITLDFSEVFNEFDLTPEQAEKLGDNVIRHITSRFYEVWSITAGKELHSSRKDYINSLQLLSEGKMEASVVLRGKLNNMIEQGVGAFDMKLGFMKSPKAKMSKKGGWYITIPFRFATPGALGESSVFNGGVMPKEIYAEAKNLEATKSDINVGVQFGDQLKLSQIPEHLRNKGSRGAVSNADTKDSFADYQHKNSIYEGITRSEKTYANATQSMYNSFRRVSLNSDPASWVNSGITARNVAEKALQVFDIGEEVSIKVDQELNKYGF